jgi:chorismate mutase
MFESKEELKKRVKELEMEIDSLESECSDLDSERVKLAVALDNKRKKQIDVLFKEATRLEVKVRQREEGVENKIHEESEAKLKDLKIEFYEKVFSSIFSNESERKDLVARQLNL